MGAGRAKDHTVKKKRQCVKSFIPISLRSRRLLVCSKTINLVLGPGFLAKPVKLLVIFSLIICRGDPSPVTHSEAAYNLPG